MLTCFLQEPSAQPPNTQVFLFQEPSTQSTDAGEPELPSSTKSHQPVSRQ